jgi:hypothetical protein
MMRLGAAIHSRQVAQPSRQHEMTQSLLAFVFALTTLCVPAATRAAVPSPLAPVEAIQLAAEAAPDRGVDGTFLVTVKATGEDKKRGEIYLNSELDYRDQRNLTIRIEPSAVRGLQAKFGKDLKAYFLGKTVLVTGAARRVTVYFGKPRVSAVSGHIRNKYYFQTHVPVVNSEQILLAP